MSPVKRLIGLTGVCLLLGCSESIHPLLLDVRDGYFTAYLREEVEDHGEFSCDITVHENRYGEKSVPSVILTIAQDFAEDHALFLYSTQIKDSDQRIFGLRTFNSAKPIIDTAFLKTTDHDGKYTLRLAWHTDGSISYQVSSGKIKSEEIVVRQPGFYVRHVSVYASGVKGMAMCGLQT